MAIVHKRSEMGIAERREREREQLRERILEAARDLLSEQGLAGLSMRAIADRIEYSPATIYLYFKDKEDLVHEVVHAGFRRLHEYTGSEVSKLGETAGAAEQYSAMGRAYARFALENTAYFRVMFELPGAAQFDRDECAARDASQPDGFEVVVDLIERATAEGSMRVADARRAALIDWGLIHGLTSLYLSGHLVEEVRSNEEFMRLVDEAMRSMHEGRSPGSARMGAMPRSKSGPRVRSAGGPRS
ncbi:MAG: TetR/AcrR family transcriptional regulator [Gemmatimonadetes bacterium]|nr:TetR/AcrR family transcriptional regulator [Gemmatimonadota bacterium]